MIIITKLKKYLKKDKKNVKILDSYRSVAQLVEYWSPKPLVARSIRVTPASIKGL